MTRGRLKLKPRLALVGLALLSVAAIGCGGSDGGRDSGSHAVSSATHLLADEDGDDRGGEGYYDGDDGGVRYFGHAASAADTRAIGALVGRYYAAAAAEEGSRACAMLYFILAESIPEMYGRAPAPRYMNGDTCPTVLARLFEHFHSRLAAAPVVSAVRVDGARAYALLGSTALPAGYVELLRDAGSWKIDSLLAVALP